MHLLVCQARLKRKTERNKVRARRLCERLKELAEPLSEDAKGKLPAKASVKYEPVCGKAVNGEKDWTRARHKVH